MVFLDVSKTIDSLKRKGYSVSYFENAGEASAYLVKEIENKTVGFGDSETIASLQLYEKLSRHNRVYAPQYSEEKAFVEAARKSLLTDVFVTSVNAFSETGEMVNIDGTGNRIAGSVFGHQKVYVVVGTNKLVHTLEDAIWRARNIAAPRNAKRLGLNTPCATQGTRCYDCSSKERICNSMVLYLHKMDELEMEIVLIDQPLGY